MQLSNSKNVSTTYDMWYDVEKIEYYKDGEIVIYFKEKDNN